MKILISSIDHESESEVEVSELHYDRAKGSFWMRCVAGDDWFQQVTSELSFKPRVIRFVDRIGFVVFNLRSEAEQFASWLVEAQATVDEGFRTMRG